MILKQVKTHRNICHVVDSAEDARYGYLVMQSCTGGELFDKIAARKCNERDSAMAVLDVLSALNFIHGKRIIHRDLKPENLLYKDKQVIWPTLPEKDAQQTCPLTRVPRVPTAGRSAQAD